VDMPHFRKLVLIYIHMYDGRENLCYGKGALMFQSELWVGNRAFDVSGLKPDFISLGKGGEVKCKRP